MTSLVGTAAHREIREHLAANTDHFLDLLKQWLRIQSIGTVPAHRADVLASAEWLGQRFAHVGFPTVEIWPTPGHPAVYAEWVGPEGAPTVLVYGHHDVQPVDPLEAWDYPPFEPTVVDTEFGPEIRGRGAIDDKGQVAFHLLALMTLLAVTGATQPPLTLKFLVEGEEESGSPHFADLLRANRDRLACDAVLVSDTGIFARDVPSVCVGMRGLIKGELRLTGSQIDLHSGMFGGAVPNPAHVLARLIADLHDADGRVTIPGFYDGIMEPSSLERELLDRLPFASDRFLADSTARAEAGEGGWSTLERIWVRPTAEVNGMWSGYTGAGSKTIVPSQAAAKLSFRTVPGQQQDRIDAGLREWLAARIPAGITYELDFEGSGVRPCLTPMGDPYLQAVVRAMSGALDQEILFTREGGSGPEADLAEILEAPVVFLGLGLPDDRIHAPNEKADVTLLIKGAEAAALLWADLGSLG